MAYALIPATTVGVSGRLASDCHSLHVPMIIRTFPNPEPDFKVTVDRRDMFWRINGKIVPGSFAKAVLRGGRAL